MFMQCFRRALKLRVRFEDREKVEQRCPKVGVSTFWVHFRKVYDFLSLFIVTNTCGLQNDVRRAQNKHLRNKSAEDSTDDGLKNIGVKCVKRSLHFTYELKAKPF